MPFLNPESKKKQIKQKLHDVISMRWLCVMCVCVCAVKTEKKNKIIDFAAKFNWNWLSGVGMWIWPIRTHSTNNIRVWWIGLILSFRDHRIFFTFYDRLRANKLSIARANEHFVKNFEKGIQRANVFAALFYAYFNEPLWLTHAHTYTLSRIINRNGRMKQICFLSFWSRAHTHNTHVLFAGMVPIANRNVNERRGNEK